MRKLFFAIATAATLLIASTAFAQEVTLANCGTGNPGDNLPRSFYFLKFPGSNVSKVTVGYSGTAGGYTFTMTARAGAFDGPIIGTATNSTVFSGGVATVTYDFNGAPVTPGTTVTFNTTMTATDAGVSPTVHQSLGAAPCPLAETDDSTPPLSSWRRDSFGAKVTTRAPTIGSLTPDFGLVDGGTTVTVGGTYLVPGATVFFGDAGVPLGSVSDGGGSGTVSTPAHDAGIVSVSMFVNYENGDGGVDASVNASYDGGFTYVLELPDAGQDAGEDAGEDAGSDSGATDSGTKVDASGSDASATDGSVGTGKDSSSDTGAGDNRGGPIDEDDSGCSCRTPGGTSSHFGGLGGGLALLALGLFRRRYGSRKRACK
jgi:hypothetical protein